MNKENKININDKLKNNIIDYLCLFNKILKEFPKNYKIKKQNSNKYEKYKIKIEINKFQIDFILSKYKGNNFIINLSVSGDIYSSNYIEIDKINIKFNILNENNNKVLLDNIHSFYKNISLIYEENESNEIKIKNMKIPL